MARGLNNSEKHLEKHQKEKEDPKALTISLASEIMTPLFWTKGVALNTSKNSRHANHCVPLMTYVRGKE